MIPTKPKLGPMASPLETDHAFLQSAPAPNYWAFAPYAKPQFTSSACSVASVTAALNGLLGLPAGADQQVMTQAQLLDLVGDADWSAAAVEDGIGVTFDQLISVTRKSLAARGMTGYRVTGHQPGAEDAAALAQLRADLARNEQSAEDVLLLYFNQGVITGDWDGPHVSLIGAYDAPRDRVLVLEVDQHWHSHYWTPTATLLAAMCRPTPADHGPLAGQTGGYVRVFSA